MPYIKFYQDRTPIRVRFDLKVIPLNIGVVGPVRDDVVLEGRCVGVPEGPAHGPRDYGPLQGHPKP